MRIGIFGLGSIGRRHVFNLFQLGERDLRACEPKSAQGSAFTFSGGHIEIIGQASMWAWKPEVVLICTPPETHYSLIVKAVTQGAHVFVEKPFTQNFWQSQLAMNWVRESNRKVAIGYQLRFNPIGITRFRHGAEVTILNHQDMSEWPSQYEKDVLEEFSHEIDLAIYLNGPATSVRARRMGALSWEIDLQHQLAVSRISIDADARNYVRFAESENARWLMKTDENDKAYVDELGEFLAWCQGGPRTERLCMAEEAVHVVAIIEACRQSAEQFKVVKL